MEMFLCLATSGDAKEPFGLKLLRRMARLERQSDASQPSQPITTLALLLGLDGSPMNFDNDVMSGGWSPTR